MELVLHLLSVLTKEAQSVEIVHLGKYYITLCNYISKNMVIIGAVLLKIIFS